MLRRLDHVGEDRLPTCAGVRHARPGVVVVMAVDRRHCNGVKYVARDSDINAGVVVPKVRADVLLAVLSGTAQGPAIALPVLDCFGKTLQLIQINSLTLTCTQHFASFFTH